MLKLGNRPGPHEDDDSRPKVGVLLLGDVGVGKSALLERLKSGSFSEHPGFSMGVNVAVQILCVDGEEVKVVVWDLPAPSQAGNVMGIPLECVGQYFALSEGFAVLYDVRQRSSFEHVESHIQRIRKHRDSSSGVAQILIVGAKMDVSEEEREVTTEEGEEIARSFDAGFIEISCLTDVGVDNALYSIVSSVRRATN